MKLWPIKFEMPSWRVIGMINLAACAFGVYGASTLEGHAAALFAAAGGGANFAVAVFSELQFRQMRALASMQEAFQALIELNKAMLEDRVRLHVMEMREGEPAPDHPRPRLH